MNQNLGTNPEFGDGIQCTQSLILYGARQRQRSRATTLPGAERLFGIGQGRSR